MAPERSIVELLGTDRNAVGLGFVLEDRRVVTCAHVVNAALKRDPRDAAEPSERDYDVRFPFATGSPRRAASLIHWAPVPGEDFDGRDFAGLRLDEAPPAEVEPAVLAPENATAGEQRVQMWGPVPGRDQGGHVTGVLLGSLPGGRRQLNQEVVGTFRARPGFSGGPVWMTDGSGRIAGMLVAIGAREQDRDVYVLDVEKLGELWADVLMAVKAGGFLTVKWGPAGFGLPDGEFVYLLGSGSPVECALLVTNHGPEATVVERIEVMCAIMQLVPAGAAGLAQVAVPELPVAAENPNGAGLRWQRREDGGWVIDTPFAVSAGDIAALPVIGIALDEIDDSTAALRPFVALPSLRISCDVALYAKRERVSASLTSPVRILLPAESPDGGVAALVSQLDITSDEREVLRAAYEAVRRFDSEVREQLADALNVVDLERQLSLADAAIAREPERADGYVLRGDLLLALGRDALALEAFDKALEHDPQSASAHRGRGEALFRLGRELDALGSFDRAVELGFDQPAVHVWRALALAGHGRDEAVVAALEQALKDGYRDSNVLSQFLELLEPDSLAGFRRFLDEYGIQPGNAPAAEPSGPLSEPPGVLRDDR